MNDPVTMFGASWVVALIVACIWMKLREGGNG